MFLKRLSAVISAVIVLSFSPVAQGAEQFLIVGSDSDGVPFKLDTWTMGEKDKKFGRVIKIYQIKNDSMFEYALNASCGDERLFIVGSRIYNSNSRKISEQKEDKEIPAHGDSAGSTAMKYYCQAIKARGWVQQQ